MKASRGHSLFFALSILALIAAMTIQSIHGLPYQLRLSSPALNYWFVVVAALSIPFLIFWIGLQLRGIWSRRLAITLAVLFTIPCLFISGCSAFIAPALNAKTDDSYQLISEGSRGSLKFRLYRSDCGATCAYAIHLREERDLFFGLKLVSPLWFRDRTSEGRVQVSQYAVRVLHETDVLVVLPR